MPPAEIQLLLREDYPTKSGGDLVLAREFELALNEAGHRAELAPVSRDALATGSGVAHLFNVDRFFEFAASASALQAAGRPYAVSPVHHPVAHLNYFESHIRSGTLKAINAIGRGPFGRERIKHAIRGRDRRALVESLIRNPRASVAGALRDAALIVVQAPSELAGLGKTFGIDLADKTAWVPNGVTYDTDAETTGPRDIDVLVAGRIEERKNQLGVARALAGTQWNVTFVGAAAKRNVAYAAKFHRLIESAENLRYVSHVPLEELRRMYARSKVVMSASFVEVVSLAELEAVAYGCQLISTTTGYMRDYLGETATYVDPMAEPDVMRGFVDSAIGLGLNVDGMELVRDTYSWAQSHARLVDAYDNAGLLHT